MRPTKIQWALFAAAGALTAAILLTFERRPRATSHPAPMKVSMSAPSGAGQPTSLLSGFDFAETEAGKTKYRIHADRTVGFAQGAGLPSSWYGLEKVSMTIFTDSGEPVSVKSDRADYDPRSKAMHLSENVVLSDPAGASVRTARMNFDPRESRVVSPGAVQFSRGGMIGNASSAVYSLNSRELSLSGPVTASGLLQPGAPSGNFSAGNAVYRRDSSEIVFGGQVRGIRGAESFTSERLTLHLSSEGKVTEAIASGAVSGVVSARTPANPAAQQFFFGNDARMVFDDQSRLTSMDLTGTPARIESPGQGAGASSRRVMAPRLQLRFSADQLSSGQTFGNTIVETDGRDSQGRAVHETATGERMEADFDSNGEISSARFDGDVRINGPQGAGRAPRARFDSGKNQTTLLGDDQQDAQILSSRGTIVARRIEVDSHASTIRATGRARAYLKPGEQNASVPKYLSSSKLPTRGKADEILLEDREKRAHLTGSAALWQGDNALFGDRLDLADSDRSARAEGRVRAVSRSGHAAKARPSVSTITSERMHYEDTKKTAMFEGHVVATRDKQVARGDTGEARFNENDQIDRTVLSGHARFRDDATGRTGEGDRLVDEPLAGVTVLSGEPAVAEDGQGNRVRGAVLTFRKESGTVEVKAKEGEKIETVYQTHGR